MKLLLMPPAPNVVIFGECGSGKSSIVNMIAGEPLANTSSNARGCTFESTAYTVTIHGQPFNIYDTAGLDEGHSDAATAPTHDAIIKLFRLLKNLQSGVNLLIFCMRGPRIKDAVYKNWRLFYEIICQKSVPVVLAITGLEDEVVMHDWYLRNKGAFQKVGMFPQGVACLTAIRGKPMRNGGHRFDEEYEESQKRMWDLVRENCLEEPWQVQPVEWLAIITEECYSTGFCWRVEKHTSQREVSGLGIELLKSRCEMTQEEAEKLGRWLAKEP